MCSAASSRPEWLSFSANPSWSRTSGAGGIVGVTRVINAAPDGYTLLLGTVGTHAYNQWVYKRRRYDAISDFTPVVLFSE